MHFKHILLLSLIAPLAACDSSSGQEKGPPGKKGGGPMGMGPAEVAVVEVQPKSLPVSFEYTGQTTGSREAEVRARVGGILLARNFKEGTLVSGPDMLLPTVMQVDPIWVVFGMPDNEQARMQKEVEAGRLALPKNGFEVSLRLADGSVHAQSGKLNFSDVRVSPTTGTRE